MLYTEFLDGQGLGNQLWNYITLRSISKKLGFGYEIINREKFKGKNFLEISYEQNFVKTNLKSFNNKINVNNIFNEKLFYDNELKTFTSDFDENILKIKPNTLLRGLFQSEKYFFNYDINEFIKLKKESSDYYKIKNHCLLNIRGGEYKRYKDLILPKSYWINAIKNMKRIKKDLNFSIVTDDYNYASKLLPEIDILRGNIHEDFSRIFYAKYIIVSNSSFPYFPINLGEKPKYIIAPAHWARFANNKDKWVSPANYYKSWSYQNQLGKILSKKEIKKSLNNTRKIYDSYYVLTTKESVLRNKIFFYIPSKLRKLIKKILSKIFPLKIG
tara:strand:+ start:666 stop:1652 length:987 start_codon:yes stop_codon:yes gene_type:complete